ncbi:lytic transglycosylase domain-containing protein [Afifella pfennigii]|uniref:lytic transglycosylase domain-containing protein n=1 Tax=Afifella pfennigii TaxID=209897 RepID=UPI00068CAB25
MKALLATAAFAAALATPAWAGDTQASKVLIIAAGQQAAAQARPSGADDPAAAETGEPKSDEPKSDEPKSGAAKAAAVLPPAAKPEAASGGSKALIIARSRASQPAHKRIEGKSLAGKSLAGKERKSAAAKTPGEAERKTARLKGGKKAGSSIQALVSKVAATHGVPAALAHAVVTVESRYNPRARGAAGEVGLMQIKPATARGIGYRGSIAALYDPETNLEWGMRYLARAYQLGGGTVCGTALRYNAGHYAKRMTRHTNAYCGRLKAAMASGGREV